MNKIETINKPIEVYSCMNDLKANMLQDRLNGFKKLFLEVTKPSERKELLNSDDYLDKIFKDCLVPLRKVYYPQLRELINKELLNENM
jgi:hypothetical protein